MTYILVDISQRLVGKKRTFALWVMVFLSISYQYYCCYDTSVQKVMIPAGLELAIS